LIEVSFTSIKKKDAQSIFALVIPYEVDDEEVDDDFDPSELYKKDFFKRRRLFKLVAEEC